MGTQTESMNVHAAVQISGCGECLALSLDVGESPSVQERLPKASQSAPRFATSVKEKKRRAVVIGDSLLRATEDLMCCLDPSHREVCCLLCSLVRDVARNITRLVKPSDYYPLEMKRFSTLEMKFSTLEMKR